VFSVRVELEVDVAEVVEATKRAVRSLQPTALRQALQ